MMLHLPGGAKATSLYDGDALGEAVTKGWAACDGTDGTVIQVFDGVETASFSFSSGSEEPLVEGLSIDVAKDPGCLMLP